MNHQNGFHQWFQCQKVTMSVYALICVEQTKQSKEKIIHSPLWRTSFHTSQKSLFRKAGREERISRIACAPEKFQKIMEQILAGCEGCLNYMDDIIIYGDTQEHLNKRVTIVLNVLKEFNVVLNDDKCIFGVKELEFLGHKLSADGITPTDSKIEAIKNFRKPSSMAEVRSFLGLVNFVGKFIPNLATTTEPLRLLTRKNTSFQWTNSQQLAFDELKKYLSSDCVLVYYCLNDRTQLYADASPVGLGAVLVQMNKTENNRLC